MYKEVSKIIFDKLLEEKLISKEAEQEATNIIERELNNNIAGLEDLFVCAGDELEETIACEKKVKYHDKLLNIDNYYNNGGKLIIISNNKEYPIYNELGLYAVSYEEKDYIEVFDVVDQ